MNREQKLGALFSVVVCISKVGVNVLTPLYLDCLNPFSKVIYNISEEENHTFAPVPVIPTSFPAWERIDPFFGIWMSMGFDTVLLGSIVLILFLCVPGTITEREIHYPHKVSLMVSGSSQAVSALLYQFSTSGTRTPPYLQAPLNYFYVPIAFSLRFIILHKKPTRRKLLCAFVVILGEVICLLPVMFPSLESRSAKQQDGGAQGIAGVLWPMVFVLSQVPHAIWNILLEKGAKDKTSDHSRLNMAFIMFFNFLGTFTTALLLFWIDLIPGFGLMPDIRLFFPQLMFNLKCIFGAEERCRAYQMFTAWGRMIVKTTMFVSAGLLVRYGEGANLYAILVTIATPTIFLVFALIDEQTATWHPHATISTWLSLGALAIMIPAVILYNTGADEVTVESVTSPEDDETEPLVREAGTYGSINTESEPRNDI